MATIQTAIQLQDRATPVVQNMVTDLNHLISSFQNVERASTTSINTSSMQVARTELTHVQSSVDGVRANVDGAATAQRGLNREFQDGTSSAGGLFNKVKGLVGMYAGLYGLKKGLDFFKTSIEGANAQIEAETKLTTVMRQRMSATNDQIQSVKNFTSAQQGLGVVGDEVQMAGAQQLATFLNTGAALETLIPAMNNLAVQQNGVDVTSENLVNVSNLMGKAMQGQAGALSRVGITFSEAEEQALKYGNEQERAAILAQIITNNVGNMNEALASTPAGALQQQVNAWGDIKEEVGGKVYPAVMNFFNVLKTNMGTGKQLVMGFAGAFSFITYAISGVIGISAKAVQVISDNWSTIGPVVLGLIGILALYKAAVVTSMIAEGVSKGVKIASAIASYAHAAATRTQASDTATATVAQYGLNAAMLASPITWIIVGIIAVIAAFYAVIAIINKVKGTAISATGVIFGAFLWLGAMILNTIIGVMNAGIQYIWARFVEPFIGIIEWVLNVANGGFDSFGGAVANLVGQIISWFLSMGKVITKIIDAIFGTNWTAGLSSLQDNVLAWGKNDTAITLERNIPQIGRVDATDAYDTGYNFGKGIDDKVKGLFGGDMFAMPEFPTTDTTGLESDVSQIANNTGGISDSMEISKEDLKYMRDVAEREVVNRFTTAQIAVDFKNTANINSNMDIDGVMNQFTEKLREAVDTSAEAVHYVV